MRAARAFWLNFMLFCAVIPGAAAASSDTAQPAPIILISVDTLRADHLSAYGYRKIRTPHIDSFAQGGTLFSHAETQIPLTLPSHMTLFTSTYPFENRVEENGEQVPHGAVTLASILRARGYKTAAFIGSDFLDRRYGLDVGFDVYDSPFDIEAAEKANPFTMSFRRDGALVLQAARRWLDANQGEPVFVFVHLFDLHQPYTLPAELARAHGISRYDQQLEYVDEIVGRFQEALMRSGWWEKSLVVLLADHGEGLGDHQEADHGYFIYESTLHVPLIFHWPKGGQSYPAMARTPAGLIDVAPTILEFLGAAAPASFEGKSQLEAIKSGASEGTGAVYSESRYAHDAFRWAALRAVRVGNYKFIEAPKTELYDLESDPHEQQNLISKKSAVAEEMRRQLGQLLARFAPSESAPKPAISPEVLAQLESLGYLAARPHDDPESSSIDPKDRLREYELYRASLISLIEGHAAAAAPEFRRIVSEDPQSTLARFHLGESYLQIHKPMEAVREWTIALRLDPSYAPAAEALGQYWLERGDSAKARLRFEQVLALTPASYTGHFELAMADERLGLLTEAQQELKTACQILPSDKKCVRALNALEEKIK
ncbi:MAG TPA: sulfatase-like hydrolase/transferase [Candidatus Acidoferrum sp.]|nr:sulfatase-like hydrolase/transferase [Candidatus Acidoferrum sp.]